MKWNEIQYYEVTDFSEVDNMYAKIKLANNSVVAFGITK